MRKNRIERIQKKDNLWKKWFRWSKKMETYSYVNDKIKTEAKKGKSFVVIPVDDVKSYLRSCGMGNEYEESYEYNSHVYDIVVHKMQPYYKKRGFDVYFKGVVENTLFINNTEIRESSALIVVAWDVWSVTRK